MNQKLPNAERNPGIVAYAAALFVNNPHFLFYCGDDASLEDKCVEAGDLAVEYINVMFDDNERVEFDMTHAESWLFGRV